MNNAFLRATRYAKGLLIPLAVLFSVFSGALHATVTWDGANGVANWLKSSTRWAPSTTNGCLSCHTGGSLALDTFSAATSSALEIVRRVETLPRSDSDCMPATVSPCPSVVDTDLVSTWVSQSGRPVENAPLSTQTNSASSIDRTGATLEGDVNANGLTTTYIFEWELDDGEMNFTDQTPPPLPSTPTTNGGLNPETVSQTVTGLDCETDYQFRVGATNDASTPAGSYTYGSTQSFATAACNFPVVRFGGSEVSGVGQTVSIPIILEGDASTVYTYPTNIQYQISGTAAQGDIDIASSTLPINSPDTSANLTFNIINNTMAPADETVVIEVTGATDSSGSPSATVPGQLTYTVVITGNDNAPPPPPLQVRQAGLNTQYVFQDKKDVTVTANANGDGGDQFSYNWDATDSRLEGVATGNSVHV